MANKPPERTVQFDRYGRGSQDFRFVRDDCRCVKCGAAEVWVEAGSDDYYTGESYLCAVCGCVFSWQISGDDAAGEQAFRAEARKVLGAP